MLPSDSLEVIVKLWKSFDLEGRRVKLDQEFAKITEAHEESKSTRKKLAEDTKNFQKSIPEEKLKKVSLLVRSYQDEIDRLTRRSKFAESAFTELYTLLEEIPDPTPVLTAALEETNHSARVTELQLENQRFQQRIAEYEKEFQDIQNQEVTIRRLEERNKEMEQKMQELVDKKVFEAEEKLKQTHKQDYFSLQEREQELQHQVAKLRVELQQVQKSYGDAQANLFFLQSKYDEDQQAKQSQLDILLDELEQLRAQHTISAEKVKIKEQVEKAQSGIGAVGRTGESDLLNQKEAEIQRLQSLLIRTETTNQETLLQLQQKLQTNQLALSQYEEKVAALSKELEQRPTQEDLQQLRKELQIYKAIDHNVKMEDLSDEGAVEKILKEKNRSLESELTNLKVKLAEKEEEVSSMSGDYSKLCRQIEEQQELISTLENDIAKLQYDKSTNISSSSSSISSPSLNLSLNSSGSQNNSAVQKNHADDINDLIWNQGGKATDESSMLQIICSQRDRFKARCTTLEKEVRDINRELSKGRSELEALKLDNVKLFEKIKYLQTYQEMAKTRSVLRDMESTGSDALEDKYRKLYEDSVNPFAVFNRKERDSRYKELNAAERIALNAGRFFLSGKYMRTFSLFYILSLHLLVFASVYKLALNDGVCLEEAPLLAIPDHRS